MVIQRRSGGPRLHLPKGWPAKVQSSVLHVIALAKFAAVYTRSWAVNSSNQRGAAYGRA